jgi:hypothetical protein
LLWKVLAIMKYPSIDSTASRFQLLKVWKHSAGQPLYFLMKEQKKLSPSCST